MSGYKRDIVVRVVPRNGAERVYWFEDELTDAGGHTRCTVRYPETMTLREDINRNLRPVVFGVRPEVDIETQIATMADQAFLSEIEEALLLPRHYNVFLSLDGGVIEREVVLARGMEPDPLRGKTYVGARFTLALRCKSLISRKLAMTTDLSIGEELLPNGNLDAWASSTDASSWTETISGSCTITQESSVVNTAGGSSAKLSRIDGGSLWMSGSLIRSLSLRCWYRFKLYARNDSAADNIRAGVRNATKALEVSYADGRAWAPITTYGIDAPATASFTAYELYLRAAPSFESTDAYLVFLYGVGVGRTTYFDDVSLYGPVLRPGYSTW